MGDTAMNVPIKVRTHELKQLHEMVPAARRHCEQAEMDEQADEITRVYDEHIANVEEAAGFDTSFRAHVSMPADDWRTTISSLGRVQRRDEGLRAWWLRKKLASRLRDRLEQLEDDD